MPWGFEVTKVATKRRGVKGMEILNKGTKAAQKQRHTIISNIKMSEQSGWDCRERNQ